MTRAVLFSTQLRSQPLGLQLISTHLLQLQALGTQLRGQFLSLRPLSLQLLQAPAFDLKPFSLRLLGSLLLGLQLQ